MSNEHIFKNKDGFWVVVCDNSYVEFFTREEAEEFFEHIHSKENQ